MNVSLISQVVLSLAMASVAFAQQSAGPGSAVPVTVDNFPRAESDLYMSRTVQDGGLGKFIHRRMPAEIENQTVIRLNRDTLYSSAVVDLDAGPVTITLPDAGKRFMSLQVINEDHYVPLVSYKPGPVTLTRAKVGTRYAMVGVRTLVDPNDPKDLQQVHALQDALKLGQKGSGTFEIPKWDEASLHHRRLQERLRPERAGRSDPPPDHDRRGLGRQSRQGRDLSELHAREE